MFQEIISNNIITALLSGLAGSFIGSTIAVYGSFLSIRYLEYLRQSEKLKGLFRSLLAQIKDISHAANLVENKIVDNAVSDIMPYFTYRKRRIFSKAWQKYRYDKEDNGIPSEYIKNGTAPAKQLIQERLFHLISLLK